MNRDTEVREEIKDSADIFQMKKEKLGRHLEIKQQRFCCQGCTGVCLVNHKAEQVASGAPEITLPPSLKGGRGVIELKSDA